MRHPDPKGTGARDSSDADASLGSDVSVSSNFRAPVQARPLGPRPHRARRARFARRMVFGVFPYRHARAIDYDRFVDRKPDQRLRRWRAST